MIVRELISRFGFQVDKKGFKKANSGFAKLKKAAAAFVAVVAAGKVAMVIRNIATETAALGDQLDKVSTKLGVNAQALQELRFAARQTGVRQQTLDMAMQRFARRSAEAAKGTGEAKDALKELGVKLKDSHGRLKPVEELLGDVADGLKRTKSDGDRLRLSFKLFDSEGAALVNTLKGGSKALDELRQKARDTGGILNDELIAASVEYTDTQHEMSLVIRGFKNLLAKDMLPAITRSMKAFMGWADVNREIIAQNIHLAVKAIGIAFERVFSVLKEVFWIVKELVLHFYDLGKQLSVANPQFFKFAVLMAAVAAAILLPINPLILLGILLAVIVEDFALWWKEGDKANTVMGRLDKTLGGNLSQIKAMIQQTEKGGPAVLEWAKVWDGAMMAMSESSDEWLIEQKQLWHDIKQSFLEAGRDIKFEFRAIWLSIRDGFIEAFKGIKLEFKQTLFDIGRDMRNVPFFGLAFKAEKTARAEPSPGRQGAFSPSASINVNVQASPGQEPEQLGGVIGRMVDEKLQDTFRQTARANTPAAP